MKKVIETIVIIILGSLALYIYWYHNEYSMEKALTLEYNLEEGTKKVFIATQGSEFKNELVDKVVASPILEDSYIYVSDIAALETLDANDWDVLVIVHTWEMWKAPLVVQNFMTNNPSIKNLVVYATSGSGEETLLDVDGISGASFIDDVGKEADKIITKIKPFIYY